MPVITFESGQLPEETKARLITELTDLAVEITGFSKSSFIVSIREQPDENIAMGGKTVKQMRAELEGK